MPAVHLLSILVLIAICLTIYLFIDDLLVHPFRLLFLFIFGILRVCVMREVLVL